MTDEIGAPWLAAGALLMLWLALLVSNASFGGLIHLLLLGALVLVVLNLPRDESAT